MVSPPDCYCVICFYSGSSTLIPAEKCRYSQRNAGYQLVSSTDPIPDTQFKIRKPHHGEHFHASWHEDGDLSQQPNVTMNQCGWLTQFLWHLQKKNIFDTDFTNQISRSIHPLKNSISTVLSACAWVTVSKIYSFCAALVFLLVPTWGNICSFLTSSYHDYSLRSDPNNEVLYIWLPARMWARSRL